MKRVTYAQKSLLMDDDTADWILEYARALGTVDGTDAVTVAAISAEGNAVEATLLLNRSTDLMTETTSGALHTPRNSDAVRYMQERVRLLIAPPPVQPEINGMPE